ncbi:hypothetical protein AAMO2058_001279500 [Amorphochlora amoebiformis]|mmetsp:Transcript_4322/g.6575  ORF Transcript_4322/g.6575 Transcript_4322/m.6575 type:complete len:203 (-) Transcript_4322:169-777(-)
MPRGRGRGRFGGRGHLPKLWQIDEDGPDKVEKKPAYDIQKPTRYPVVPAKYTPFIPSAHEKKLVEKMREIETRWQDSGYNLKTESKQGKLTGNWGVDKRKKDLLNELPSLSSKLYPKELVRALSLAQRKDGEDIVTASTFLSADILHMSLEDEEEIIDDVDLEGRQEHESDEDGGDYDLGAHVDNDEDNVNAFGDDSGGMVY